MTNPSSLSVAPVRRVPTKTDYKSYKRILSEIHTDIETIDTALRRVTRNLKTIHDRHLYLCGHYATFEEFCNRELGKSRQQVYRLLQAHDVMQTLLESGVSEADLPQSERLCREIRKFDPDEQARVWKAVTRITQQRGRPATIADVQQVGADELESPSAIERQQRELIQKFQGIHRAMRVGLRFDTLDSRFRRELIRTLLDIGETITVMVRALQSPVAEERVKRRQNPGPVLNAKGTVDSLAELPSSAEAGDYYTVSSTGRSYAWNGSAWDDMGSPPEEEGQQGD